MAYPFKAAKWFKRASNRRIDFIVIHDEEYPERPTSAEDVAQMFSSTNRMASAHFTVDADSLVQCVRLEDIAFHAPPNEHSIGIEHSGYARQSRSEWLDDYGQRMLDLSARLTAELCIKYGIPAQHISPNDLKAGKKGIVGHVDVSQAWGQTDHTDPGSNFPWDYYLEKVLMYIHQPNSLTEAAKVMVNGKPIAIQSTPSGNGYYIVANDGGVFCYGDAVFHGSTGGIKLNAPVCNFTTRPENDGYWLLAEDFGVFAFGNASYFGHP